MIYFGGALYTGLNNNSEIFEYKSSVEKWYFSRVSFLNKVELLLQKTPVVNQIALIKAN